MTSPSVEQTVAEFLANLEESMGPGMVPSAEQALARCGTDEARLLWIAHQDAGGRSISPEDARELADAGWAPQDLPVAEQVGVIGPWGELHRPVLPVANARLLAAADLNRPLGRSRWLDEAFAALSPAALDRALDVGGTEVVAVHDRDRGERLCTGLEAGLRIREVESGHDLETLLGLLEATRTTRGRTRDDLTSLASRGHTAATVREYGVRLCNRHTADELISSGVPAAALRSLVSRGGLDLPTARAYHGAGITRGADVREVLEMAPEADPSEHARMLAELDLGVLGEFWAASGRRPLRLRHVRVIGRIVDAGHTVASLQALTADGFERRCVVDADAGDAWEVMVALIDSGLDAARIGAMSRAGVAPEDMAGVPDDADLWELGAANRARYEARPYVFEAPVWPWTEETYLSGRS